MATVRNKTHAPLRVHLSSKKVLHLGPGKEGKVSDRDLDHRGVQHLVEAGELEIVSQGGSRSASASGPVSAQEETHGHHPDTSLHRRGDR